MKTFRVLITACALVCFGAAAALAQPIGRPDRHYLTKKVDSFAFVVDTSGSMMMTSPDANEPKIVLAKRLIGLINDRIPDLDYNAGLFTLAPAATPVQAGEWNRLNLGNAVAQLPSNLPIFKRLSPLGQDISALQSSIGGLRNGAIILVSDGYENLGPDTVAAFRSVLQSTGVKLHIISFADNEKGKATLDQLGALSSDPCANGRELLFNPVALDEFVLHVFYDENAPVITDTVFFATGKYDLTPEAMATLDRAALHILNNPRGVRTIHVEGYADAQGGVGTANLVLSNRRAAAVRDYLEAKGVQSDKIYARGNNVSFEHNNSTAQGRHDNRRADLIIN